MLEQKHKLALNKILLVAGLTLTRLPRVFGLDNVAWIILLTLVPFWYVILENQIPEFGKESVPGSKYIRLFIQLISLVIIAGIILLLSIFLVETYEQNASIVSFLACVFVVAVFLAVLIFGIVKLRRSGVLDQAIMWIGIIYFLVLIVSMVRASVQASYDLLFIYQTVTVIVFCLSSITVFHARDEDYFKYVFMGLVLYLFANVLLNVFGIGNVTEVYLRDFDSVLLSTIGLESMRVFFPMAEGINSFGMVAGLGFAISAGYLVKWLSAKSKSLDRLIIPLLGSVLSIYVILRTDSRGALLFSVIAAGMILFFAFIRSKTVFLLTFLSQLSVFGVMTASLENIELLAPLIRENSNLLSGRGIIWQAAIDFLRDFEWIHVVGYGLSGHAKSGLIHEYSYLFASYVNKTDIYLHHFALQSIFDVGYIGLIAGYILMIVMGIKLLQNKESMARELLDLPVLAGLIFIIFAGSVSIVPALYAREIYFLFPFIWASAGRS